MLELNAVYKDNFFAIIQSQIVNNPDIINFQDKHYLENSYISLASYRGDIDKVLYLLENNANIYLLNKYKDNVLHEAVAGCRVAISEKTEVRLENCLQIFKILLNYEVEQRAYYPAQYINIPTLKEQKNHTNFTPLELTKNAPLGLTEKIYYPHRKELVAKLKNSIEEAEIYYQKCLENKANNIPLLEPYHRQFLPEIKQEEALAENVTTKWSDKILSQGGLHQRRRSKSAEEIENEQQKSMKLRSRSAEIENFDERKPLLSSQDQASNKTSWMEWLFKPVIQDTRKNKNEKTL